MRPKADHAHEPEEGFLAPARKDEARPASLLRGSGRCSDSTPEGSCDGHEALSEWNRRQVLFHETRADLQAGLAAYLLHYSSGGKRNRLPSGPRPRLTAVGCQSGLYRPESMVRTL